MGIELGSRPRSGLPTHFESTGLKPKDDHDPII
jgi:hypothetical protein